MDVTHEYFGSDDQRRLQARAAHLWGLLKDDPRFYCHGRAVGIAEAAPGNIEDQIALTRLQGVSSCGGVSPAHLGDRRRALEDAGLATDQYVSWEGAAAAAGAARAVLAARSLADDLSVCETGPGTPAEDMQALDALTQGCGVLLPMGAFLRGRDRPAACVYAKDREGRVVGASAAVAQHHPDHPRGPTAWWGMLSTDGSRRGEGIALILGARSMLAILERGGCTGVCTGIREGNGASEALCLKLGLQPVDETVLISISREDFGADRVTK